MVVRVLTATHHHHNHHHQNHRNTGIPPLLPSFPSSTFLRVSSFPSPHPLCSCSRHARSTSIFLPTGKSTATGQDARVDLAERWARRKGKRLSLSQGSVVTLLAEEETFVLQRYANALSVDIAEAPSSEAEGATTRVLCGSLEDEEVVKDEDEDLEDEDEDEEEEVVKDEDEKREERRKRRYEMKRASGTEQEGDRSRGGRR
eukprot:752133-Hanusia_phi.AAC.1